MMLYFYSLLFFIFLSLDCCGLLPLPFSPPALLPCCPRHAAALHTLFLLRRRAAAMIFADAATEPLWFYAHAMRQRELFCRHATMPLVCLLLFSKDASQRFHFYFDTLRYFREAPFMDFITRCFSTYD